MGSGEASGRSKSIRSKEGPGRKVGLFLLRIDETGIEPVGTIDQGKKKKIIYNTLPR